MKPGLENGKGFTFNHLDQSIYLKIHVANQQQVLLAFAGFNILCKNAKPHMQKKALQRLDPTGSASAQMFKDCEEQDDEEEIPLPSLRFSLVCGS